MTKCGVFINAGREASVASTKAFTCQVISLALVALWFAEKKIPHEKIIERHQLMESIKVFVLKMFNTLQVVPAQVKPIAEIIARKKSMIIMGKGTGQIIAQEGALKLKEICYIHAEGYAS